MAALGKLCLCEVRVMEHITMILVYWKAVLMLPILWSFEVFDGEVVILLLFVIEELWVRRLLLQELLSILLTLLFLSSLLVIY